VIVVDEASVMPTRALERLAHAAAWRSSRLVLVGDRAQLPSVDAGGGFAALADRLGATELTENRRQQTGLQRDVARHLAEGARPTRSRCCPRAVASGPSTTRATRGRRSSPRGRGQSSTRRGAT
jgi:2-polyprenyl-6-methoxyphenol hydroxylase-like FAD-dependent oxidoreductase